MRAVQIPWTDSRGRARLAVGYVVSETDKYFGLASEAVKQKPHYYWNRFWSEHPEWEGYKPCRTFTVSKRKES